MQKLTTLFLSFLMLFALTTTSSARDLKIGVVDVEYIIHASKKGKAAKASLERLVKSKQKTFDAEQKKLLDLKTKIERQSEMASEEKRRQLVTEYQQSLVQLQEKYVQNQQDLAKKEVDLMKPILKSLEKVLTDFAKDGKYDLIMNRSEQGVLFTHPNHDITKAVLAKLDAQ